MIIIPLFNVSDQHTLCLFQKPVYRLITKFNSPRLRVDGIGVKMILEYERH